MPYGWSVKESKTPYSDRPPSYKKVRNNKRSPLKKILNLTIIRNKYIRIKKIYYNILCRLTVNRLKDTPNLRGATFAKFSFFRSN